MKEPFGPFLEVPSSEIQPAGFTCPACREPVRKWSGHFFPEVGDFMLVLACKCISAGGWELRNPIRTAQQWFRVVLLAKKHKCEFVSLVPKGAAVLYGQAWK
jgi:hypothetical protein